MLAMQNPLDRLRIGPPPISAKEREETRKALEEGVDILACEGASAPTLRAIIWRLAQNATETLAAMPDRERSWLLSANRSIWPELARPSEDNRQVEWEIAMEKLAGVREKNEDGWHPNFTTSDPTAPRRCLTVLSWLRYVRARTPSRAKRDKLVFLELAAGRPFKVVRRLMGGDHGDFAVLSVKGKVLKHIEEGLSADANLKEMLRAIRKSAAQRISASTRTTGRYRGR